MYFSWSYVTPSVCFRQDQLIIQMIRLMDGLLRADGLDLRLTPYSVLATSTSEGFVQFIKAIPLREVISSWGTVQVIFWCVSWKGGLWVYIFGHSFVHQAVDVNFMRMAYTPTLHWKKPLLLNDQDWFKLTVSADLASVKIDQVCKNRPQGAFRINRILQISGQKIQHQDSSLFIQSAAMNL